jgi:hypothetical protein
MPALRYEPERVARMVAALNAAATSISRQL